MYYFKVDFVVVIALFNVRQPEAAKDGPGFTPWQAYLLYTKTKEIHMAHWHRGRMPPRVARTSRLSGYGLCCQSIQLGM